MPRPRKDKDLTVNQHSGTLQAPDYIERGEGGLENIGMQDLKLSYLKLLQDKSPEIKKGDKYKPGLFVDSMTGQIHGKEVEFIVLIDMIQAILWKPREEGGGQLCQSFDGKQGTTYGVCKQCKFNYDIWQGDSPPSCTKYLNFPALLTKQIYGLPISISFDRTKIQAGQNLAKLYSITSGMNKNIAWYGCKFKIYSWEDRSKKANVDFWNVAIEPSGFASSEEYAYAKQVYQSVKKAKVSVEMDGDMDSIPPGAEPR